MDWLKSIADYGIDVISLGVMAFVLVKVIPALSKKDDPKQNQINQELVTVVKDNAKAYTELTVVIRDHGELIRDLIKDLTALRLEIAKGRDRQ